MKTKTILLVTLILFSVLGKAQTKPVATNTNTAFIKTAKTKLKDADVLYRVIKISFFADTSKNDELKKWTRFNDFTDRSKIDDENGGSKTITITQFDTKESIVQVAHIGSEFQNFNSYYFDANQVLISHESSGGSDGNFSKNLYVFSPEFKILYAEQNSKPVIKPNYDGKINQMKPLLNAVYNLNLK